MKCEMDGENVFRPPLSPSPVPPLPPFSRLSSALSHPLRYTIADMAILPWFQMLRTDRGYQHQPSGVRARDFLNMKQYTHAGRWADMLLQRPAVQVCVGVGAGLVVLFVCASGCVRSVSIRARGRGGGVR